jgi:hypothetical protein
VRKTGCVAGGGHQMQGARVEARPKHVQLMRLFAAEDKLLAHRRGLPYAPADTGFLASGCRCPTSKSADLC